MITPTEMKDHAQNFLLWSLRFVLVLLAIALFWIILQSVVANSADNIPACLTQKQARDKYPHAHLYWYYQNRKPDDGKCWSNHRGRLRMIVSAQVVQARPPQPAQLNSIRWYPQPFDSEHTPVDPPLLLNPIDETLPGNIYWSEEPNEIDKTSRPPFAVWEERITGALAHP